ncbi:translation initiation factor IF-2 [Candidatus Uhrbacteria bacterium CG11_big_fil_rev_8_21_14_0_20_41_9]|nr:MAG: translation initiation factor IF-2 [Candidatus Uhrbacteria bacterium CG11_big_fil_rev_8_21_14_0_20_41_9]
MNITELARRLRVPAEELRNKLPDLGFDIGSKALKVPDRDVNRITRAWGEYRKRQYLVKKREEQRAKEERKLAVKDGTADKVSLPPIITVRDFAEVLNMPIAKVMQELMRAGILASLNERIDFATASIVAEDLGFLAEPLEAEQEEGDAGTDRLETVMSETAGKDLETRPPVIVVMGHVDHGKTRLLDAIRDTNVMGGESGGITQHIGAYQVNRHDRLLTFIDTPGHEAFTVMRSRGAKVSDIAIIVVAADDGIQPQTIEAINIVKAAKMPFIIAINKIDKENANVERVKGQLGEHNLIPEEWGGETLVIEISAKNNINIDKILDTLILVTDIEKDKIVANPNRQAIGTIIESHIDKGQGPVATVLVQTGTLKNGDVMGVRGVNYGRVRAMKTWDGKNIQKALPSTPVKILGLKDAPSVGDILEVPEDAKLLEKLKAQPSRKGGISDITVAKTRMGDNTEGSDQQKVNFNLIIKADVLGSLEAVVGMIEKIENPYVGVKIVSKGLGSVTDSEVLQAEASKAVIAAFNVKPTKTASALARDKKVKIGEYTVIYKLFEDVVEKLRLLIPAEQVYTELGAAKILKVFKKLEKSMIVGGQVTKGKIELNATTRVIRDEEVIGEGKITALQTGKADVKEVEQGLEFGIEFTGKIKIEEGDILEVYKEEEKARTLDVHSANR